MTIETHTGIVTDNQDPEKRLRIKVACATLLGDEETDLPMWIPPVMQWGWILIPDVGEEVDLDVIASSEHDNSFNQSSIDSLDIKWKGNRHYTNDTVESPMEARPVPEDFLTNYGKRRGFATPMGHIFYFDDTPGNQKVQLSWYDGEKYQFISFDETGSVVLSNKNGTYIYLDSTNAAASVVDENGNSISMNAEGIKLIDKFGNVIELKNGAVQIISQAAITMTGGSCSVATGSVDLANGADEYIVKGTSFKITYDTHTHPGPFGPTGVPVVPMTNLSTVVKTK